MQIEAKKRHCIICNKEFEPENPRIHTCMEHRGESTARFRRRHCCRCGEIFEVGSGLDWYFCSSICKMKDDEGNKKKHKEKAKDGIELMHDRAKIAAQGHKEHLTYGQMVAKYGL